ncbi:BMP family ABC transporter substrate-binding protein [Desulfovibrio sp. JC010]|uniref:BMP family ABC transporter substrate-binding protein n=1 Tax=Desulfovibrio sp. JC010 TaxID=2593641 RepID=UPI0013D54C95|nr:BMP family ABC transporter substrate-binding protein [Desulfovibrio sp. JC010]NDV25232.1 BMP family ABC transporter substrate-binding protein [Desulfovibrio sp. JC010]
MRIPIIIMFFLSAVLLCSSNVSADTDEFNPVLVYQGPIDENSFTVSIHKGVERFKKKTGDDCTEVVIGTTVEDYVTAITQFAEEGYSPIFLLYGNHFPDLVTFARKYPATRFIILDTVRDEPNIYSFVLADHEGSFLAGALAAMASKSGKLGFVSVVDTPFQRRFLCGYTQGAKYINPDIEVLKGFIGNYENAWFDGNATSRLANQMMDEGADVIYQAAGGAGPAVLEACAARGKLGIGVDINQNGLYPGSVLTSMVKQTDKAIYAALMLAKRGIWRDNYKRLGLEQEAVGIVFDEHNKGLVTPEMRSRIENIRKKIVLGEILVNEDTENPPCPNNVK